MKVSITIPCRNEEAYIGKCLDSIVAQDYPKEQLEVFVCDGKSDDNTQQIVKEYEQKHPFIHLLMNEQQTTPFALNLGIKESNSDVAVILGAHSELASDYVSNCVKTFEKDATIGCVGGIIENEYENASSAVIGLAMSSPFGVGNAHFRTGDKEGFVDTVAFGAYKREVFEKAGYFDEALIRNQDDEFNFRVIKNGFKIYLSKAIRCKYYVRASYQKLFRQYFQYGYWKVFVNKKHRTVTTIRQLIPMFFVLFLVVGGATAFLHEYLLYTYLGGLGLYTLVGLLAAAAKTLNPIHLLGVFYSFIILHLSYGWGYINGILRFLILNKSPKKSSVQLTR